MSRNVSSGDENLCRADFSFLRACILVFLILLMAFAVFTTLSLLHHDPLTDNPPAIQQRGQLYHSQAWRGGVS
ncbi:MAG TPA: hypothetical protein VFB00_02505 [Terriglobales bacterium]|nr:hypothetical protein [Terriglobales bacterium]